MARPQPPASSAPMTLPPTDYNVLLVVLDDVGVEWFAPYAIGDRFTTDPNFKYVRTPTIARLQQTGLMFQEAYTNPICGATRACIHTGQYALRTGFGENLRDPDSAGPIGLRLSDSLPWLPRAIHTGRPGVYETGMFGKWHLSDAYNSVTSYPFPPPNTNLDHAVAVGYDHSAIHFPNYGGSYSWYKVVDGVIQPTTGYVSPPYDTTNWSASVHVTDALAWINTRTKPWFANVAFNAPHAPFTVPPFSLLSAATIAELNAANLTPGMTVPSTSSYFGTQLVWRAAMESVDTCIGQLLSGISPAEMAKTMVIVSGDNGTVVNALPPGFLHSKREVYRGGSQVPLLVQGPLVVQPGRKPVDVVHSVDLYATILDIVRARPPATVKDLDGVSFLPVIQNSPGKRKRLFTEVLKPWGNTDPTQWTIVQRALFDGRWRYVVRQGVPELYDDHADFLEATNVLAANPDVGARMKRELDEMVGS